MSILKKVAHQTRKWLTAPLLNRANGYYPTSEAASQLMLKLTYSQLAKSGDLPPLREVGFKAYSQTDEDGILLFIFSVIGTTNKMSVEICAGDGIESNTANLIINHGWIGLLIDGNPELVQKGREFYSRHGATFIYPPTFLCTWVTRDNVNQLLRENGYEGEIDLLSVDIDGIDYWLWNAIEVINPRVVVVEYQDILGPEKALTVPYKEDFNAYEYPSTLGQRNYFGASLPAFVKLADKKGYRLVGCNKYCYNAFFVRRDLAVNELPEVAVEDCLKHPKVAWGMKERLPTIKELPWVEV